MAIYKPTDMQPAFTGFDVRDINANKSIWFSCKIDTNNTNVTAYSIELYDEENNLLFPFGETGDTVQDKLKNKLSMVEDLYAICQKYDEYKTYISQYGKNVNTGINGSYLVIPFFVNQLDTSAGTVSRNQIDLNNIKNSGISNNKKFKWNITLYQGVEKQGNEIILPNNAPPNDKYFDMVVTNGLVVGSTMNRIQTMFNDDLLTYTDELFIQPTYMTYNNGTPVDSNDVNGWLSTSFSNVSFQNIGHRELIESYDSFLAHIYPDKDKLSLSENGKQANTYHLYKVGDNPENLTEYQKAGYFIDCCVPWVWTDTVADPSQAYGTQTYKTTLDPKEYGFYPFSTDAIPGGEIRSGTSGMSVYRGVRFASEQSRERCILNYQKNLGQDETSGSGSSLMSNHNGLFYPTFVVRDTGTRSDVISNIESWSATRHYYVGNIVSYTYNNETRYYVCVEDAYGSDEYPRNYLFWDWIPTNSPASPWLAEENYKTGDVVCIRSYSAEVPNLLLQYQAIANSGPGFPQGPKMPGMATTSEYWIPATGSFYTWDLQALFRYGDYIWMYDYADLKWKCFKAIAQSGPSASTMYGPVNPINSPFAKEVWREIDFNIVYTKIYDILVTWHRTADADMWGELDKKIIYIEKNSPYKAGQNVQITYTAPSQGFPSINETKLRFINEQPLEVFALPDGITSSNNYSKNTGLIFYDREKTGTNSWTKIKDAMVYIRPSTEILPNMRWIKKTDENLFFDIDYIDSDYWNLRTSKDGFPKINPDTPYVIKSYFRRSDTVPFDAVQDPEIVITPSDNTVITQPKFTASAIYDQDRLRQWRSFQWQLFQNNELLSESDIYYDGIINHDFYVVDNSPEFGVNTRTFYINKDVPAEDIISGFTINDIVGFEEIEVGDCVLSANGNVYKYGGRGSGFVVILEYLYSLTSAQTYEGKILYCVDSVVLGKEITTAVFDTNFVIPDGTHLQIGSFVCSKNGIVFKVNKTDPVQHQCFGPYKYTLTENGAVDGYHYCYYYPDVIVGDAETINKNNIIIPSNRTVSDIKVNDIIYTVDGKLFKISNINNDNVNLSYMFLIDIDSDGNTDGFNDNYLFYYDGELKENININNIYIPNGYQLHIGDFVADDSGNIFLINNDINEKSTSVNVSYFYNCFNNYILKLLIETEYGLKRIVESRLRVDIDYEALPQSLKISAVSDCSTNSVKISLSATDVPEEKIYEAQYSYSLIGKDNSGHYCYANILPNTVSIVSNKIEDVKSVKPGDLLIGSNAGVAKVVSTGNVVKVEYLYDYQNIDNNFDDSINKVRYYNKQLPETDAVIVNEMTDQLVPNDLLIDNSNNICSVESLNPHVFLCDRTIDTDVTVIHKINIQNGKISIKFGDLIISQDFHIFKITGYGSTTSIYTIEFLYNLGEFYTDPKYSIFMVDYPISGNRTTSISKQYLNTYKFYNIDIPLASENIEINIGNEYLPIGVFIRVGDVLVGNDGVKAMCINTGISDMYIRARIGDYHNIKKDMLLVSYSMDDPVIDNIYGVFKVEQVTEADDIKVKFLYDGRDPNTNNVFSCDLDIKNINTILYGSIKNDNIIQINDFLFNYLTGDVSIITGINYPNNYTCQYKYNINSPQNSTTTGAVFGYLGENIINTNVCYTTNRINSSTISVFERFITGDITSGNIIVSKYGGFAKILEIYPSSGGQALSIEYLGNLYSLIPDLSNDSAIYYIEEDIDNSTRGLTTLNIIHSDPIKNGDIIIGQNGGMVTSLGSGTPAMSLVVYKDNLFNFIETQNFVDGMLTINDSDIISTIKPTNNNNFAILKRNNNYYSIALIVNSNSGTHKHDLVYLYDINNTNRNSIDYLLYLKYISTVSGSNKNKNVYYYPEEIIDQPGSQVIYGAILGAMATIGDIIIGANGSVARVVSDDGIGVWSVLYLYSLDEAVVYYSQDINLYTKYIYGKYFLDSTISVDPQDYIISVNGGIANAIKQITPDITNMLLIKREVWRSGSYDNINPLPILSPINEGVVDALSGSKNLLSSFDYFDYNVGNKRTYEYSLLIQIGASSQWYLYKTPIEIIWDDWSITELHPTEEDNVFTASDKDVWKFKFNISPGEISQNFIKNQQDTLGLFPKIFHGPKKALSGSVSCLMGRDILPYAYSSERFEYEVNNVTLKGSWNRVAVGARGIGGYTEALKDKISRANSSDMLNAWREVCYSTNPKLLKDAKGNIYIVEIIDGSSQVNEAWSSQQPETISFSWIQIADGTNYQIYSKKGRV